MTQPHEHPNKFEIAIIYNGVSKPVEVNRHQSIQAVFDHALKLFGSPSGVALFTESGTRLDTNLSVEASGISPGTRLLLRPISTSGG